MSLHIKDEHKHEEDSVSDMNVKTEQDIIDVFKEEPKELVEDTELEYSAYSSEKVDIKSDVPIELTFTTVLEVYDNQEITENFLSNENKEISEDDFTALNEDANIFCKPSNEILEVQQQTNVIDVDESLKFSATGNENNLISQRDGNPKERTASTDKNSKDNEFTDKVLVTKKGRVYSCDVCGKTFNHISKATEHWTVHSGEKAFICDICNSSFTRKVNLNKHMRHHIGDLHHQCEFCKKLFTDKQALENHTRVHTRARPFACEFCDKRFSQKSSLKAHAALHTGNSPHVCDICNKSFCGRSNLEEHKRIHTGVRPHTCGICEKSYAFKTSFDRHMRLHTGDKPFVCKFCGRSFSLQTYLSKHIKIHKFEIL